MVKEKIGNLLQRVPGSLLVAGIIAVAADLMLAWWGVEVRCSLFLLAGAVLTGLLLLLNRRKLKKAVKTALWTVVILAVVGAGLFAAWKTFSDGASYVEVDSGKAELYQGRKVMVIIPHQDDELNLMSGVLDELVRYGSDVYPVYITNGDYKGWAEDRIREALDVFAEIGVPQENVIFLGYGDGWKDGDPHLYNAESGAVLESHAGYTQTYGTKDHDAWQTGVPYTVDNYLADIQSVILTYRPDVIFCTDYDSHEDHKATTLAFEKVMGWILKSNPDYHPLVFKGYAYSTAWNAGADFYGINILATDNVFEKPNNQKPEVYRWEERVRLPVGGGTLSRSLPSSKLFQELKCHVTQGAQERADRIINGDKVFWYRATNSLCHQAQITVSSGNGALLNDFMLLENTNVLDDDHMPHDGVWIPEGEEKQATVTFDRPQEVRLVRLYDSPSEQDNILAGKLLFDDGTEVKFGPLDSKGAAVTIDVGEKTVSGFTVILTETEGENPGLTEIEAFDREPTHGLPYVKLMDESGNFLYDYWTTEGANCYLSVYSQCVSQEDLDSLQLSWDNQDCWAEWDNGKIRVIVPEGKSMKLQIAVEGSDISDTVQISNPEKLTRLHCRVAQFLEKQILRHKYDRFFERSAAYKLLVTALDLF